MRSGIFILWAVLAVSVCAEARPRRLGVRPFEATAFTNWGITKSGIQAQRGLVAADTRILPLGTTIRVSNAGPYSGTYTVADTGSKIQGRHIDIYMPSRLQARRFGKKLVRVRVLKWGEASAI